MGHNPTEHVQEHVTHEAAHGGHGHGGAQSKWITAAALTAAILAAFAAVTGMLATKHLTESTQKRIAANDQAIYAVWTDGRDSNIVNTGVGETDVFTAVQILGA